MRRLHNAAGDRGAAAVEFALVLPILLLVVFGIIDFGRAYNAQITLTQAAREGVRLAALGQSAGTVQTRAQNAAVPLTGVNAVVLTPCPAGSTGDAVVQTNYTFSFVTPVGVIAGLFGSGFGGPIAMTGRGVMRCQG
jgi:Flp pilus assembly protein TadG